MPSVERTERRICLFGGRDFTDYALMKAEFLKAQTAYPQYQFSIVSGMARGADALAVRLAKELDVTLHEFPANWKPNGVLDRGAGYKRNTQMAEFAHAAIGFWDGKSKGTLHSANEYRRLDKPVVIVSY